MFFQVLCVPERGRGGAVLLAVRPDLAEERAEQVAEGDPPLPQEHPRRPRRHHARHALEGPQGPQQDQVLTNQSKYSKQIKVEKFILSLKLTFLLIWKQKMQLFSEHF